MLTIYKHDEHGTYLIVGELLPYPCQFVITEEITILATSILKAQGYRKDDALIGAGYLKARAELLAVGERFQLRENN